MIVQSLWLNFLMIMRSILLEKERSQNLLSISCRLGASNQEDVQVFSAPLAKEVFDGCNCTVFIYKQIGTEKLL